MSSPVAPPEDGAPRMSRDHYDVLSCHGHWHVTTAPNPDTEALATLTAAVRAWAAAKDAFDDLRSEGDINAPDLGQKLAEAHDAIYESEEHLRSLVEPAGGSLRDGERNT